MHFGIFVEEMRYGASQVSAFHDAFELARHAEDWGLDCVWLGEIHFTPDALGDLGHRSRSPARSRAGPGGSGWARR